MARISTETQTIWGIPPIVALSLSQFRTDLNKKRYPWERIPQRKKISKGHNQSLES